MTANDKRAERRVPVALRIRLRYQALDQFISKFAINISRGGLFLSSRNPKPIGTRLQFEIRLADDTPVIEGSGEVRWIREYDRNEPNQPHGMGIRFLEVKPESRALIERIIQHRRSLGEPDDESIPEPRRTAEAASTQAVPSGGVTDQPASPETSPPRESPAPTADEPSAAAADEPSAAAADEPLAAPPAEPIRTTAEEPVSTSLGESPAISPVEPVAAAPMDGGAP